MPGGRKTSRAFLVGGARLGFMIAARTANHGADGVIFAPSKNHDSGGTRVDTEPPKAAKEGS